MQFLEKEICQLMDSIWAGFLGLPIAHNPEIPSPDNSSNLLTSCLHITGGWEGMVTLNCPTKLASMAATSMFGVSMDEVTEEQTLDAMAELTNMTGGNLKALMPPPCNISLPILTEHTQGTVLIPGSRKISEVAFKAKGLDLIVTIFERDSNTSNLAGPEEENEYLNGLAKQREFTRVSTKFNVIVTADGKSFQSARTRDLSIKGVSILTEILIPVGSDCRVAIQLGSPDSGIQVRAQGTVVRRTTDGLAIQFKEIDVDSYNHLRNMVLLNSKDEEKMEEEIHDHVGLKPREGSAS